MHLATAHVERESFEAVQDEVERATPALRPLLALLRDTFWAGCIERDMGWYMMSGAVETPKAKAIRYLVQQVHPGTASGRRGNHARLRDSRQPYLPRRSRSIPLPTA